MPHVDALDHRGRIAREVRRGERADQRGQAQRGQAPAVARDAVGHEEGAGEDQRRAEVALEEEEQQHQRHADGDRDQVGDAGQVQAFQDRVLPRQGLGQLAQPLPPPREVAGQEQRDERPDRLDGLHAEQVDLHAAAAGARAEDEQQHRQAERAHEEHEGEAVQLEPREVDQAGDRQRNAADRHADRERLEQQPLAPRVVDADHRQQAEAAQRAGDRQDPRVADGTPQPPDDMRGQEGDGDDDGGTAQRERKARPGTDHVGVDGLSRCADDVAGGDARDGKQEGDQHGRQQRELEVGAARLAVPDAARGPARRRRDAARGARIHLTNPAKHRGRRAARIARREEEEYWRYSTDEQRSEADGSPAECRRVCEMSSDHRLRRLGFVGLRRRVGVLRVGALRVGGLARVGLARVGGGLARRPQREVQQVDAEALHRKLVEGLDAGVDAFDRTLRLQAAARRRRQALGLVVPLDRLLLQIAGPRQALLDALAGALIVAALLERIGAIAGRLADQEVVARARRPAAPGRLVEIFLRLLGIAARARVQAEQAQPRVGVGAGEARGFAELAVGFVQQAVAAIGVLAADGRVAVDPLHVRVAQQVARPQ